MIAHIVLFTPKPGVTSESLGSFAQAIRGLSTEFPTVQRAMIGRALSIDPGYSRNMGQPAYQYSAILEFNGEAELLAYLRHPKHSAIGRMFWELCESTVVVEVEAREPGNWKVEELV